MTSHRKGAYARKEQVTRLLPEQLLGNDSILLTHNRVAILQGLLDCPRGVALSTCDLARAALPYVRRYREDPNAQTLWHAARRLPARWVSSTHRGNCIVWKLTARGRAIAEHRIKSHVRVSARMRGASIGALTMGHVAGGNRRRRRNFSTISSLRSSWATRSSTSVSLAALA
jgi:hypothetical protein